MLAEVAGGYRFQTHPDMAPYVEQFVLEGQHVRLSAPALETLAIVAYKQPITRGQISAIRGVNVESTLADARAARATSRRSAATRARASRPSTAPRRTSSSGSGSPASPTCRRWATSCPAPEVVEALERGLRADQDPRLDAPDEPTRRPPSPSSPRPTDAPVTTPADARRADQGAGPEGPRPGRLRLAPGVRGADRRRPGDRSTGARRSSATGSIRSR